MRQNSFGDKGGMSPKAIKQAVDALADADEMKAEVTFTGRIKKITGIWHEAKDPDALTPTTE